MKEATLRLAEDLELPLDAATQTFAFIARKGAGKTYAAGKLAELLLEAGVQVVILDTVGNWYGLRLAADGKGKGFDVPVFGGLRGDLPLQAAAGELIADVAVDTGRSLILDLSQFSLGDRKRFAVTFGERLWRKKKAEAHPSPLFLVIEESQLIIPQQVTGGGDTARMVGIYEEIVRLGRNYGIGCAMISQRPQSVNKEVLNQAECLVVLQVNGSQERKALREWITHQGMDVKLLDELPSLPIGTAYVWSPQWLGILRKVKIARKTTFDASATPRVGDKTVRRDPAPLDLGELQERMAATVEHAKQNDPRELRREVTRLNAELRDAQIECAKRRAGKEKLVEVPVIKDAQIARLEKVFVSLQKERLTLFDRLGQVDKALTPVWDALNNLRPTAANPPPRTVPVLMQANGGEAARVAAPKPAPTNHKSPVTNHHHSPALGAGEMRCLSAIGQHARGVTREQLTVLTGYKRSTRNTYLQRLHAAGYITTHAERIYMTDGGRAALGDSLIILPTGAALQQYWLDHLPQGEREVFRLILGAHPGDLDRESITTETGYKRSTRNTYLQRLQSRELVTSAGTTGVRASDFLFDLHHPEAEPWARK